MHILSVIAFIFIFMALCMITQISAQMHMCYAYNIHINNMPHGLYPTTYTVTFLPQLCNTIITIIAIVLLIKSRELFLRLQSVTIVSPSKLISSSKEQQQD